MSIIIQYMHTSLRGLAVTENVMTNALEKVLIPVDDPGEAMVRIRVLYGTDAWHKSAYSSAR